MKRLYRYLLYILPLVLCFSYYPLIKLGENETMYFELSLPLLWLVAFDAVGFLMVITRYRSKLFSKVFGSALWWLFPIFVTFSVIWSLNVLRGILTVGLLWALFFAVVFFFELRENLDAKFWKIFWRWFFSSALFVCVWCVIQCAMDVLGVPKEASLLCDGCVYQMFGFPHPNGFTIEPQFMGNLLLAPIMVATWMYINNQNSTFRTRVAQARLLSAIRAPRGERHGRSALVLGRDIRMILKVLLLIVLSSTLFLTFSRGAIYACIVGLCFLFAFSYFRAKKAERKKVCFSILKTIGVFVVSFLFTLNLQGILAASSPTSDTYGDGVAKVLNQLSLGVIDIRESGKNESEPDADESSGNDAVENSNESVENLGKTESAFDGYVAESTDTRVRLSKAAFDIWRKDFKTIMVGVGIGGAGQALYDNGLSPAPREIVQNEYMSLLLETGVVGVFMFILILIMAIRVISRVGEFSGMILALLVAYGVTLLFFSGFPNAMQIVLLPGLLTCFAKK